MRVFISSWGERSKAIAEILHQWLPRVIQAVRPYSSDDIPMGARLGSEIASALEKISVGIICLTSENLKEPSIMFEAGALSKSINNDSKVCPLLFGVAKPELEGPLLIFQAAEFDKKEMKRVINMINVELRDDALAQDDLEAAFEIWWPKLETAISEELKKETVPISQRTERDLLEEILERTRVAGRLEREFKGRLLSSLGYVIGEMSFQPGGDIDRDRLSEAVRHCQQGYDYLKEVGEVPEFLGLNNLVYYSIILNEPSKRAFLLTQGRRLREAGQDHKASNLILTACRAILQFSPDEDEKRDARKRLTALLLEPSSEKERKEAERCLKQFPEPS